MQQTETYKLNLIEKKDVFSPDALNENMEKLEVALEGRTDAADTEALDARVTALEVHKIAIGHYIGNGETNQFIPLPFTPTAVLLDIVNGHDPRSTLAVTGYPTYTLEIVSRGFKVSNYNYDSANGGKHCYIAFC